MRHHDPDIHLTDDELLRAMIDPSDLAPARQAHLASCRQCRRRTEDLTARFSRLGPMARHMAPEPRPGFRVPAHRTPAGRWHLKPAMALAAMGALVFAVTLWAPFDRISRTPAPMVAEKFANDDQLMEAIDTLVEDALPEKYQHLAALPGDRSIEDLDEFMDWMVPSPDEADDGEQPANSGRESRQAPIAWSDSMNYAERGMV